MMIGFGVPLQLHGMIMVAEDADGRHCRCGWYRRGRELKVCCHVNIIHHFSRRKRAMQDISDVLGAVWRKRGQEIILIRAHGQVVRGCVEGGDVGLVIDDVRHSHRTESGAENRERCRKGFGRRFPFHAMLNRAARFWRRRRNRKGNEGCGVGDSVSRQGVGRAARMRRAIEKLLPIGKLLKQFLLNMAASSPR